MPARQPRPRPLVGVVAVGRYFDCGFGLEGGYYRRGFARTLVQWCVQKHAEELTSSCEDMCKLHVLYLDRAADSPGRTTASGSLEVAMSQQLTDVSSPCGLHTMGRIWMPWVKRPIDHSINHSRRHRRPHGRNKRRRVQLSERRRGRGRRRSQTGSVENMICRVAEALRGGNGEMDDVVQQDYADSSRGAK